MKKARLLRHLRLHGCRFLREGGAHELWHNPLTGKQQPVPRHNEVSPRLIRKICKDLSIPAPLEK